MILCAANERQHRPLLASAKATCALDRRPLRILLADTWCASWTCCSSSCRCIRLAWKRSDDAPAFTQEAGKADPRTNIVLQESEPARSGDKQRGGLAYALGPAGYDISEALPMPKEAVRAPRPASRCFPSASPTLARRPGKQKAAPKDRSNSRISLRKSGAGEGIRTLDPNLGKVEHIIFGGIPQYPRATLNC